MFVMGTFYKLHGITGLLWFVIFAIGSILLLETINYIEHYGLSRKEISLGNNKVIF
jgi:alkane 1-monooxygenase